MNTKKIHCTMINYWTKFLFLSILPALVLAPLPSQTKKKPMFYFKVEKYKLKNGLTVLLHVDSTAPLVTYQTWFRVGSQDDPPSLTGMAHLFEHMMFRGTKKRTAEEFLKSIESRGIYANAYTTPDRTVYYFDLPKKELEFITALEAERMTQLNINKENLNLEKAIVKEERLMRYENKPQVKQLDLFETAFKKSRYQWPVIGYKADIDRMNVEDCQNFYNTFYAPNNAVIVVAGPIHISKTKRIIKKYYNSIPSSTIKQRDYPPEPEQKKARTKNLFKKVQTASLMMGYRTSGIDSQHTYPLDILSFIVGGGLSSRLHQLLVEKKSYSLSVQSFHYTLQNEGLFIISSDLHPKNSLSKVQRAISQEIKKVIDNKIEPEELNRAKTNIMKSYIESLKTAENKARLIGYYETAFNDYSHLFKELDKYRSVTAKDVQLAARRYLNPHQKTLINLYPKK